MLTNGLNVRLVLRAWAENIVSSVETHRLSDKEKVPDAEVSKEGHAYCLLGHKRTLSLLISLEKVQKPTGKKFTLLSE